MHTLTVAAQTGGVHKTTLAVHSLGPNLLLLAASRELETLAPGLDQLDRLTRILADVSTQAAVIDTPPGMGTLMLAAVSTATQILIPVQPAALSMAGAQATLETVTRLSACDHVTRQAWLALTGLDRRTRMTAKMTKHLERRFPDRLLASRIPRQQQVEEALVAARTLYDFAPRARVTTALAHLATELKTGDV